MTTQLTDEEVDDRISDAWQDAGYFKLIGIMDKDRAVYRAGLAAGRAEALEAAAKTCDERSMIIAYPYNEAFAHAAAAIRAIAAKRAAPSDDPTANWPDAAKKPKIL